MKPKPHSPRPSLRVHPLWFAAFYMLAVLLRGLLCWLSPPENAFDNHYEPIQMIMESGGIPAQRAGLAMLPVLLAFNAAGIIALTMRLPIYNSMKASYLLNSTPAFMMFLALGVMQWEKNAVLRRIVLIMFSALFTLVTVHVLHIVLAIRAILEQGN